MRLYKQFAAGVLAAVLAVSMLAACGGNGTPSVPGAGEGGKPSTGQGTGTEPGGTGGDNKGDSSDTKEDEPSVKPAGKYRIQRYLAAGGYFGKQYSYQLELLQGDWICTFATDGRRYCSKTKYKESGRTYSSMADVKLETQYTIDDGARTVEEFPRYDKSDAEYGAVDGIKSISKDYLFKVAANHCSDDIVETGVRMVEGETVYFESFRPKSSQTEDAIVYCFAPGDTEGKNLLYIIEANELIYKVHSFSSQIKDKSIFQIPEGYKLYRVEVTDEENWEYKSVDTGTTTPKDNYPN